MIDGVYGRLVGCERWEWVGGRPFSPPNPQSFPPPFTHHHYRPQTSSSVLNLLGFNLQHCGLKGEEIGGKEREVDEDMIDDRLLVPDDSFLTLSHTFPTPPIPFPAIFIPGLATQRLVGYVMLGVGKD